MIANPVLKIGFVGVLGLWLLGCASAGEDQADVSDVVGKYRLVEVDGAAVPAEIKHGEVTLEVKSGEFEIKADRTCVSRTQFVPPGGQLVKRTVKASFVREGKTLKMKWERAGRTEGTVEGDRFTMDNHGTVFSYRRIVEKTQGADAGP